MQERDGHPSLHTWIRGYRDTDRLETRLTPLKPRRHTRGSERVGPNSYAISTERGGREMYCTMVWQWNILSFAEIHLLGFFRYYSQPAQVGEMLCIFHNHANIKLFLAF